jgi:hypothetical protein
MVKGPTQKITLFLPRGVSKFYTLLSASAQAVRRPFIHHSIHLQVNMDSERYSRGPFGGSLQILNNLIEHFLVMA